VDVLAQLTRVLQDRYAVEKEIGSGGMATVYLARDVRHNRKVALKVLSPELGAVLGPERFLSEIQVTANLQHPNLLPLFDSGEAEGLLFYVMPFIEGESLRDLLVREKQLPIDQAVHLATSVASALDYAHRHGVIHRDLKPENILMHDGQPVVADFGIALAVSNAGGNRITQTGLSLGTPQYMSPEQATGDRAIDGRTDVYSLGAVTYEMLAGEPPHDGKTSQAIIAKVLTDRPRPIHLSRDTVPAHVEAAVDRALAKLPADRFHTAREFAEALAGKGALATRDIATQVAPPAVAPRRSVLPWAVAALALAGAGAGWALALRGSPSPEVLRYELPVPPNTTLPVGRGNTVAISPDGRFVAFVAQSPDGSQRIYLRGADELEPREVPGTVRATFPFFSPDGRWLAFWSGGQLLKAPLSGGTPVVIGDAAVAKYAWAASGWIVGGSTRSTGLAKLPATGGAPVDFTHPDSSKGENGQQNPVALPDGKTVLYSSIGAGGAPTARIGVASLTDGSSKVLDLQGTMPLGMLNGFIVYANALGTIMAAPYDAKGQRVTGPPIALLDQAAMDAASSAAYAQMSPDGSLVYVSGVARRQLVVLGEDGRARAIGDPGPLGWPRLSPDGKRVAVSAGSLTQRDVWVFDLVSGSSTRLAGPGAINDRPEWTADGRVLFRSNAQTPNGLWIQALDGGPAQPFFKVPAANVDEGVLSRDGRWLVYQRDTIGNGEVWFRAQQGDTTPVIVEPRRDLGTYGARLSPDGKWLAYAGNPTGTVQVYIRGFPKLSVSAQATYDGGFTPVWSPDGTKLYYINGGQLWMARIGSTAPFSIASRTLVLDRGYTFNNVHADYDVGPGGMIVALRSPSLDQQVVVVRNLGTELRARLKGAAR
jgi:Tol biopolymer transport system component